MDYATKLLYQSNYWYNDGLKKATIRDLSGAMTSLKKSLQYNRDNIAARNLLGLVYYGRGEVAEALTEWILSKNFQSHENIANYYIQKVRENPTELDQINQAVKRYNQSLAYCSQNSEDMAIIQLKKAVSEHPTFVKAYQLLTLLYIHTEQYSQARQAIRAAHKLDTTDSTTLHYMHELTEIRKERNLKTKSQETKEQHTVTYTVGNETIIQPTTNRLFVNSGLHTVANIGIGILVGVAVMWFLVMPAITSSTQHKNNEQTVAFSDQIATQKSQISALKKELEGYRSDETNDKNSEKTASGTKDSYEIVINMTTHLNAGDMSYSAMAEELLKVDVDTLGTLGREQFETVTGTVYPEVCNTLYAEAYEYYNAGNYNEAISDLEQIQKMDENYNNGEGELFLAQCYEANGDTDKATQLYQKLIQNHKDTDVAQAAQKALDKQNGKSADDAGDTSSDTQTYTDAQTYTTDTQTYTDGTTYNDGTVYNDGATYNDETTYYGDGTTYNDGTTYYGDGTTDGYYQ